MFHFYETFSFLTFSEDTKMKHLHCVKSVRIRSYSGLYFPTFGLNTDSVSLLIQSECRKIWTRTTSNTDTFYAVQAKWINC